jgi:hypothetical protein
MVRIFGIPDVSIGRQQNSIADVISYFAYGNRQEHVHNLLNGNEVYCTQ